MASPWLRGLGSGLGMAGTGAAIGSAFPGPGTAIGAGLGGLAGLIMGKVSGDEDEEARRQAGLLQAEQVRFSPWLKGQAATAEYKPERNTWSDLMAGIGTAGQTFSNIQKAKQEDEDRKFIREWLSSGRQKPNLENEFRGLPKLQPGNTFTPLNEQRYTG
jgi:hypothetical protein